MDNEFVTWEEGDAAGKGRALAASNAAVRESLPVVRTMGYASHRGVGEGGASVRDGFSRRDFDALRPDSRTPTKPREVIRKCFEAYDEHAIVRNVVDMMADFVVQGIDLNHPNSRQEKWWREWARRVSMGGVSEQASRVLLVGAVSVVTFETAKVNVRVEDEMRRSTAADLDPSEKFKFEKREIPWRYTVQNPMTLEVENEAYATLSGHDAFQYAVSLPRDASLWKLADSALPGDVASSAKSGRPYRLDPRKTRAIYYKKFDWQVWPTPLLRPLLKDLDLLGRFKLADAAAIDGVISSVRIWKLGSLEHRILPNSAAIQRLSEMLLNNVGGGVMDLVWGPDIELQETSTDSVRFLGMAKYEPVMNAIFQGLGVPPALSGTATPGGFTNNFISLKTMIERLEYVRNKLVEFWTEQVRLVQKAMGFRFAPTVVFDRMTLTDEASEKQLLINLADRDLISWETLVERFSGDPAIEEVRLRRERKRREAGMIPPKASPYHDPEHEFGKQKLFIQQGGLTPSEVGLEIEERKPGEKSSIERQAELAPKAAPPETRSGQPGQGRPKNAKDSEQRKRKRVVPRSAAEFLGTVAWAEAAAAKAQKLVGPAFLASLGKSSFRGLSDAQTDAFERLRFRVLCRLEPGSEVSREGLVALLSDPAPPPAAVQELLDATVAAHAEKHGQRPTLEATRRYQAGAYACWKGDYAEADRPDHGPPPLP